MPGSNESANAATQPPAFVNTNIWVCAHLKAPHDPRHERALAVVQLRAALVIRPQVVAEYDCVMLRNARCGAWIQVNLRSVFECTQLQPADVEVLTNALDLRNRYGFFFCDCQIAAASPRSGCGSLLIEDVQHGQMLNEVLRVVNPLRHEGR